MRGRITEVAQGLRRLQPGRSAETDRCGPQPRAVGPTAGARPSDSTTSVVASRATSAIAWLTSHEQHAVASRSRCCWPGYSALRSRASIDGTSGSSVDKQGRARTCQPAIATRCFSPPDKFGGRRRATQAPIPEQLDGDILGVPSQGRAGALPRTRGASPTVARKGARGHVRKQGALPEERRPDAALLFGGHDAPHSRYRSAPRGSTDHGRGSPGRVSPAMMLTMGVLPDPERPDSAVPARPRTRNAAIERVRRLSGVLPRSPIMSSPSARRATRSTPAPQRNSAAVEIATATSRLSPSAPRARREPPSAYKLRWAGSAFRRGCSTRGDRRTETRRKKSAKDQDQCQASMPGRISGSVKVRKTTAFGAERRRPPLDVRSTPRPTRRIDAHHEREPITAEASARGPAEREHQAEY